MSDKRKVLIIAALAELFDKQISQTGLILYVHALRDIPDEAIEQAAARAAETCKFMPRPVEIRELAGESRTEDRALLAWQVFEAAVESVGVYRSPNFDDPLINATVRSLGGWQLICEQPVTEFDKWTRQNFIKTYTAFARTGISQEAGEPLVGFFERQNAILGYKRPEDQVQVATGLPWAGKPVKRLGDDRNMAGRRSPAGFLQLETVNKRT